MADKQEDKKEEKKDHKHEDGKEHPCCPPKHHPGAKPPAEYVPKGSVAVIDGMDVYSVGDSKEKGVIVFPEIFGIHMGRLKQICDSIADAGFYVVLPDLMRGDVWAMDGSRGDFSKLGEWIVKFTREKVEADIKKSITPLFTERGISKIGAIGFCWGSCPVLWTSASGLTKAGVSMHPSHPKLSGLLGGDEKTLLESVKSPQMMLAAGNDSESTKAKGIADVTFSKKDFGSKCVFKEFPDMVHGWVVKGDIKDEKIARDYAAAMKLGIEFLVANV
jgi:dienelactone hydrolase